MASLLFNVENPIPQELDIIKQMEGLGNRTSTFTFLIKYYLLTKKNSIDNSISHFNRALKKVNLKKLPSAREQLQDV